MDSCARGAFVSGVGCLVAHKLLHAARVNNDAVATKRNRVEPGCREYGLTFIIWVSEWLLSCLGCQPASCRSTSATLIGRERRQESPYTPRQRNAPFRGFASNPGVRLARGKPCRYCSRVGASHSGRLAEHQMKHVNESAVDTVLGFLDRINKHDAG